MKLTGQFSMGTRAEAEKKFLARYRDYCAVSQPVMGTARQIKERDAMLHEAKNQFVSAAALLAWHMENEDE